jgi:site-specific DNA-methyltransferase (adenine-specific)
VSIVYERRGLPDAADSWKGWRLGNLAPIYEPIAWFMKPYKIGGTIADNVLENDVGAMNIEACQINDSNPTNVLEFGFAKGEKRIHEAQKPLELVEFLIKLTTLENQVVLDPFMGSGTTAVAAKRLNRRFIGFEINLDFHSASLARLDNESNTIYTTGNIETQQMLFEKPKKKYGK